MSRRVVAVSSEMDLALSRTSRQSSATVTSGILGPLVSASWSGRRRLRLSRLEVAALVEVEEQPQRRQNQHYEQPGHRQQRDMCGERCCSL